MFNVTFEIVTPEYGDCEESGFAAQGVTLREAIDSLFETRTSQVDGIAFGDCDHRSARIGNGMEFLSGAYESRTFHFPPHTTDSSFARIMRLIDGRAGFKLTRG